jgi:hypothetical protein
MPQQGLAVTESWLTNTPGGGPRKSSMQLGRREPSLAVASLSPAADIGARQRQARRKKIGLLALKETMMLVRLKLEDTREGLVATISQRDDDGKTSGRPSIFLVGDKEEAKQKARAVARGLGLKTYRVLDMTRSRMPPTIRPA